MSSKCYQLTTRTLIIFLLFCIVSACTSEPETTPTLAEAIQPSEYNIRVELISTTIWADLVITNPEDVLSANLVSVSGNPSDREVSTKGQGVNQTTDAVRDGKEAGITVDYKVKAEASERGLDFRLQRHALNGCVVRIYQLVGEGTKLIYELDHQNVAGAEISNTQNFTLDLNTMTVAIAGGPPQTPLPDADAASIIFHNGVILTIEKSQPQAQAVAIQGNQILAVGSDSDIMALKGPQTQLIDLAGLTMMPGFIEGHSHYIQNSWYAGTSIEEMMSNLVRFGLTSETEMHGNREFIDFMLAAEQNNEVVARINIFAQYNYSYLVDDKTVIDPAWYLDNDPILDPSHRVRIPGVKIFVDGAGLPSRGCPYNSFPHPSTVTDVWPDVWESCRTPYGDLYLNEAQLTSALQTIQDRGYRASFHVMGDASAEITLNSIETVLDGKSNSIYRHQIQHNSLLSPELVQRYVQLDIIASVPGGFNTCDADEYLPIYGEEHYEWAANRFSLANLGVHVYAVGDWISGDVDKLNPLRRLWGIVNLLPAGTFEVCESPEWIAKHKTGVERALEMFTIEPAYAVSMEDYIGSILPGKFADMIILSGNPLTVNPYDLKDLEVLMTMVDGNTEYCKPGQEIYCP